MDYRIKEPKRPEKRNGRKNRYYGKVILLCVMIGFCILALIEIIYGQEKLRLEQERIALEERNAETLQALEKVQDDSNSVNAAQGTPGNTSSEQAEITNLTTAGTAAPETVADGTAQQNAGGNSDAAQQDADGNSDAAQQGADGNDDAEPEEEHAMQIVFLGDSILDSTREYDGVAYLISKNCDAKVYNLSMGGTTAALLDGESRDYNNWDSRCLLGVVKAITGEIDTQIFDNYKAGELMKICDFSKTDYFVIEYGINDFLSKVPTSLYMENGEKRNMHAMYTYGGALEEAIGDLRNAFPDAKILLVAPHYCQFFNGQTFVGDGYSLDYGYGTLIEYARACGYVYDQHREDNVLLYNAFEVSGIDAYTADDYLEDGIHLTSEGRRKYADDLSRKIMKDFYPEE